jgi:hypothetical protein
MGKSIICAMSEGLRLARCVLYTGEMGNYYKILNVKSERKRPHWNNSRRLQNDMKMDLKDIRLC